MADLVFDGVREFGERLLVAVGDEEWIVTEATGAARRPGDCAFANAFRNIENVTIWSCDGYDCDEAGATGCIACFGELRKKQGATIGVGGMRAGVARGEDSRCATKGRDFQT